MSLEKNISRRGALKFIGAGLGTLAVVAAGEKIIRRNGEKPERLDSREQKKESDFLDVEPSFRSYPMGVLARVRVVKPATNLTPAKLDGIRFSGSLAQYMGIEGRVPPQAQIDFRYQLADGWKKKLGKIKPSANGNSPQVESTVRALFGSYNVDTARKVDILGYQGSIGRAIEDVRSTLSLDKLTSLASFRDLDATQMKLVMQMEKRITAMTLLAYSLCEIAPTDTPNPTGIQAYDFLLRHAGEEYILNGAPALSDGIFSFGPYQLTPGVFRDEKRNRPQGAKLIDTIASSPNIPDTIYGLRGTDHHKAAYLFAVHNIALLARRLSTNRSEELMEYMRELPATFTTEFIAAAHHSPGFALNACEDFIGRYRMYTSNKERYKKPDFIESCRNEGDLGPYANRARIACEELRKYFAVEQVKLP